MLEGSAASEIIIAELPHTANCLKTCRNACYFGTLVNTHSHHHYDNEIINYCLDLYYCNSIGKRCQSTNRSRLAEGIIDYPIPIPSAIYPLQAGIPSVIEPTTVRNFAFSAVSNWGLNSPNRIIGAEVTPLLIGNETSLSTYLSSRLLRVVLRTRISFAMTFPQNNIYHSALGFRWMLHDDADLRADSVFQRALVHWASQYPDIQAQCASSGDASALTSCLTEHVSYRADIQKQIDSLRRVFKDTYWNRSVVEMAFVFGYKGFVNGENESRFAIDQHFLSLAAAFPFCGTSGQVLFGGNAQAGYFSDNVYRHRATLSVRGYYGSARERMFLEVGETFTSYVKPETRLCIGGVTRIANGLWLQANVGAPLQANSSPIAAVTLSFGTPEIHH